MLFRSGVQRGEAPLPYWGIFSVACNAAQKFPNKLCLFEKRSGRGAAEGWATLPMMCPPAVISYFIFPFLREDGAVLSVGRCYSLQGGRRQGFPDKYARSARKIYRETALPPDLADDRKPCITFAPTNG